MPDPLDRGPYTAERIDPFKAGLATLQEPNSSGGAPGSGSNSSITLQVRGSAFMPIGKSGKSPIIVLVHGNHSSCDLNSEGKSVSGPDCVANGSTFKRNDQGYAYMAENLATWGYAVFSLDQDEMMARQDGSFGKGMHQRRLLIAALLDALYEADETGLPLSEDANLGTSLVDKLDFTRIGMMGHSRGGDAVSSFIEYNRMRTDGRRYPLRGVISLAPVDYERRAPYGVPYMTILPMCDGDVSNLQGARMYERGQHRDEAAYPLIQSAQLGGNHNWYNSVWFADTNLATGGGDDSGGEDEACQLIGNEGSSIRLSGQAGTRISADPARMGDQEKIGLATMSAFFRRYVGGEGAFDPYMTGELAAEGKPQIPASACPTSESGVRIECIDRVATSYFAPADERLDVIDPDTEAPLGKSALGSKLSATGFSNPYLKGGGVTPLPEKTASGLAWCNPDPAQTVPSQLGEAGYPAAEKQCPLPNVTALGGQQGTRENAPVNQSYSRQLAAAWDGPAQRSTKIPAAFADVSGFETLTMAAGVAFFNTSGRIADSVIGPLRISNSSSTLPHSWGIVATNSLLGEGEGTIERHVTVDRTKVTGYKTGGILFDDATGADEAESATEPSGIELYGYVTDSLVEGIGATDKYAQTGIQYHAGAAGFIEDSKVTGNLYTTDTRQSAGILLTGADTGDFHVSGSVISGNGYGLFNADLKNTVVREAAPADAAGNYWAAGGDPVEGPVLVDPPTDLISGPDEGSNPSVEFAPSLGPGPDRRRGPGRHDRRSRRRRDRRSRRGRRTDRPRRGRFRDQVGGVDRRRRSGRDDRRVTVRVRLDPQRERYRQLGRTRGDDHRQCRSAGDQHRLGRGRQIDRRRNGRTGTERSRRSRRPGPWSWSRRSRRRPHRHRTTPGGPRAPPLRGGLLFSRGPLHLRAEEDGSGGAASVRQGGQGARRGGLRVRAEDRRRLPDDALDLEEPRCGPR